MKLLLERDAPGITCIIGHLSIDGESFCATIERLWADNKQNESCIPAGEYALLLTVSDRARRGELWTPDQRCRLPELLGVPNRSAIRMHAANTAQDVKGCIGVGTWLGGETLFKSRASLGSLIDMLEIAELGKSSPTIEIRNAL